jgi:small subunit ribosomal protein S6
MANHYETVFILTPVLSEEQAKEAVGKYKKLLSSLGAKVVHEENWGLRKLAYPIQKKNTGFYNLLQIEGPGEVVSELELNFKRDERVLRYLTVRLDKHALAYAERRRNRGKNKVEKDVKATAN